MIARRAAERVYSRSSTAATRRPAGSSRSWCITNQISSNHSAAIRHVLPRCVSAGSETAKAISPTINPTPLWPPDATRAIPPLTKATNTASITAEPVDRPARVGVAWPGPVFGAGGVGGPCGGRGGGYQPVRESPPNPGPPWVGRAFFGGGSAKTHVRPGLACGQVRL